MISNFITFLKGLKGLTLSMCHFSLTFATVRFKMCPQIACPRGCKITLDAFVWFFSTVCFQMGPQMACMRRGIVALAAYVRLFATFVRFQMPI